MLLIGFQYNIDGKYDPYLVPRPSHSLAYSSHELMHKPRLDSQVAKTQDVLWLCGAFGRKLLEPRLTWGTYSLYLKDTC